MDLLGQPAQPDILAQLDLPEQPDQLVLLVKVVFEVIQGLLGRLVVVVILGRPEQE